MSLTARCSYLKNICVLILVWLLCETVCLLSSRVSSQPTTNIAQTTATLSESRYSLAATASGELVYFGGGFDTTTYAVSEQVDIYNVTSGNWTTTILSVPRQDLAATSSGSLVFFAGGWNGFDYYYDQVDIFNVSEGSWSAATLSQARYSLAATSIDNLVLFGGGCCNTSGNPFTIVDIYNVSNNNWTTSLLSQARYGLAAASVAGRYAFFAGGYNGSVVFNTVDIYDSLSERWNTTTLVEARCYLAAASLGNLAFFGGGQTIAYQPSNIVDIFNSTSQTWNVAMLRQDRYYLAAASVGDIVAFGGGTPDGTTALAIVDIYNVTSNIWFTATLSQARFELAGTSATNQIFFGGGQDNSGLSSNVVDIFCLNGSDCQPPSIVSNPTGPQSFPSPSAATVSTTPPIPTTFQSFPSPSVANVSTTPPNSSAPQNFTAIVIGVVVAILALLIGVGLVLLILFMKRRKYKRKQTEVTETTVVLTENSKQQNQNEPQRQALSSTLLQSSLKSTQIPFKEIVIEKELGGGSYGKVYVGKWRGAVVSFKFCKNKGNLEEFMNEIKLMTELPPHPNLVQLFGVSWNGPQPIIVMEYCAGGSLDKFLFQTNVMLSNEQKIRLVQGIAAGMLHLHKHNIVHRDLAARNILLTSSGEPKISDFGMSRILEKEGEGKTNSAVGPMCWMAPESLAYRNYSKKSDVWTFGIVVYEIVAQCEPHKDQDLLVVGPRIRDEGLTPTIPSDCPPLLRSIMELCWKKQPEQRPTIEIICALLRSGSGTWNYKPSVYKESSIQNEYSAKK